MSTTVRDPNRKRDVNRIELSGTIAAEPTIGRDAQNRINHIRAKLDVTVLADDDGTCHIDTFPLVFVRGCKPSVDTLALQLGRDARIRIKGGIFQQNMRVITRSREKVTLDKVWITVKEADVIEAREPESQKIPPVRSKPMGNRIRRVQQRSQAPNEVKLGGDTFKVFDL